MRPAPEGRSGPSRIRALAVAIAALVVVAVSVAVASPAAAQESTSAEVAQVARAAITSDEALAQLRAITEVDGRTVDLAAATASMGAARAARLEALAAAFEAEGAARGSADAGAARAQAEEVLDADKYRSQRIPRPFRGVLEWLADLLAPIGRVAQPVLDAVRSIPGGALILGVGLAAGAGWLVLRLARGRGRGPAAGTDQPWGLVDPSLDPLALDAAAVAAEADGDLEAALRLRYHAGLVRLVAQDRLVVHRDTTASGAAAAVGDPTMVALTRTFEEVVYGGRPATAADLEGARSGWASVLDAVAAS